MQTKTATVKQLQGVTLLGKSDSNHWVVMDGSDMFGGSDAGSSPKELLLMALGGCTANDVIPILTKKRIPFHHLDVHLTGTVNEDHPKIFNTIHIEYVIYGENIDSSAVERAIELSTTKYCSISAMLKATVKITHSYRIEAVSIPPVTG
jgi:putative redox protein